MKATGRERELKAELAALRRQVAALEARAGRLDSLVRFSPQAMLIHAGRPLHCNEAAARLFGYASAAELLALPSVDGLYDPAFLAEAHPDRAARLRGELAPGSYELQGIRKDGSRIGMRVHAQTIDWEGAPAIHCTYTDISDLQRMQNEQRASQRLLQAVFDALPTLLFVKDRESRFLLVNRAMTELHGLPADKLLGLQPHDMPAGTEAERRHIAENDAEVFATGGRVDDPRYTLTLRDGPVRTFHSVKVPLLDAAGAVIGLVCAAQDITEQEQAQEQLRTQRRLLQTVFDAIPLWLFVKDPQGRYLMVNDTYAREVALKPEQLVGLSVLDVPYGSFAWRERVYRDDLRLIADGQPQELLDEEVLLPDGRLTIRQARKVPLRDDAGRIVGLIGLSEDITERRKAQLELGAQRRLLQAVFDAIPTWLFVKDRESRFLMVNDSFARDVGRTPADFRGLGHGEAPQGTPEQRARIRHDDERIIAEGRPQEDAEELTMPDGKLTLRHVRKVPLRDEQGQIIGIVGMSEDITERRALEEQLQRMQRMEAIGTLAGGIAHDFNNILFPIIGFTELTMRELEPGSQAHRNLAIVRDAAYRAKDIVSQILTFSRRGGNKPDVMQMRPLVREVLRFLRSTLPRTVRVEEDVADAMPTVFADAVQLHQVLMNLCVNAAHAMPEGGTLTVGLHECLLDDFRGYTGDRISGRCVRLTVRDTGVGMDAATLARIFEPFFTTKPVGQGTGLGLSAVLGIVSQHKGVVDVHSAPGAGSTFDLYFPVVAPQSGEAPAPAAAPGGSGVASILVVDDEWPVTELTLQVLGELGYRVTGFTSSHAALQAFQAAPDAFDLVITDQMMPELTGDQLVRAIRALRPELPVILGTGFGEAITQEGLQALDIDDIYHKPITPERLGLLVQRALETRRRQAQSRSRTVRPAP